MLAEMRCMNPLICVGYCPDYSVKNDKHFLSESPDPHTKKSYFAYILIEFVRIEKGPRQRVLLYMGTDLNLAEGEYKMLAERIEEILTG